MERMSMYWCLSLSKVRLLTSNFTFTHGCIGGWKRTICFGAAVQPSYHNSGSWASSDPHILWIGMLLKLTVLLWVNEGYILYFCYRYSGWSDDSGWICQYKEGGVSPEIDEPSQSGSTILSIAIQFCYDCYPVF